MRRRAAASATKRRCSRVAGADAAGTTFCGRRRRSAARPGARKAGTTEAWSCHGVVLRKDPDGPCIARPGQACAGGERRGNASRDAASSYRITATQERQAPAGAGAAAASSAPRLAVSTGRAARSDFTLPRSRSPGGRRGAAAALLSALRARPRMTAAALRAASAGARRVSVQLARDAEPFFLPTMRAAARSSCAMARWSPKASTRQPRRRGTPCAFAREVAELPLRLPLGAWGAGGRRGPPPPPRVSARTPPPRNKTLPHRAAHAHCDVRLPAAPVAGRGRGRRSPTARADDDAVTSRGRRCRRPLFLPCPGRFVAGGHEAVAAAIRQAISAGGMGICCHHAAFP